MKKFSLTLATVASILCATSLSASQENLKIGVVNFQSCAQESKVGKKEQENMENMKAQMQKQIQDIDTQLQESSKKYQDPEYVDSVSPEEEKSLKEKIQTLNNELMKLQNQFYQVLQQANMNLHQAVSTLIQEASSQVSKARKFSLIMPKEATFASEGSLDVTQVVIEEMDKIFESQQKSQNQKNEALKPTGK
jgi:outer membrane protein